MTTLAIVPYLASPQAVMMTNCERITAIAPAHHHCRCSNATSMAVIARHAAATSQTMPSPRGMVRASWGISASSNAFAKPTR